MSSYLLEAFLVAGDSPLRSSRSLTFEFSGGPLAGRPLKEGLDASVNKGTSIARSEVIIL